MIDIQTIKLRVLGSSFCFFPTSALAEPLATATSYDPPIARLVIGLLLCIFLAYAVIHVLRNVQRGRGSVRHLSGLKFNRGGQDTNQISVLETHRLNATSDVCLISWNQQEFLVIIGQHEPKLITGNDNYTEIPETLKEKK